MNLRSILATGVHVSILGESVIRQEIIMKIETSFLQKKAAEAHLALIKLHQLRDCYRQGWVPDYTDSSNKFCIVNYFYFHLYKYIHVITNHSTIPRFLSFQSKEIAEKFLNNFRDLIEQAGDLI